MTSFLTERPHRSCCSTMLGQEHDRTYKIQETRMPLAAEPGASFLDALMSGEIGGYQHLIDEVHDTATAENERRTMAKAEQRPPILLASRSFQRLAPRYEGQITVKLAGVDDRMWAQSRLGQYVSAHDGTRNFRAYLYLLEVDADGSQTLTVLVDA